MTEEKIKTRQLQLIPVFALREVLQERIADDPNLIRRQFKQVLNKKPRNLAKAVSHSVKGKMSVSRGSVTT